LDSVSDTAAKHRHANSLAAMGTANPQLRFHIGTARNVGLTRQEITDVMVMIQYYAGMPAAYNGALAAKAVLANDNNEKPYQ
jgi:4-carboxymuconolactone decarboxylase